MFFSGSPPSWPALRKTGRRITLTTALLVSALTAGVAEARRDAPGVVQLAQLPPQAQTTYTLILAGGPFPERKDGTVFGNRERALPDAPRGFYHEYTVRTPGARDRGARRIVCGGTRAERPQACFYTGDHYATFRRIAN